MFELPKLKPTDWLLILLFIGLILIEVPQYFRGNNTTTQSGIFNATIVSITPLFISDQDLGKCQKLGDVYLCRDNNFNPNRFYLSVVDINGTSVEVFLPGNLKPNCKIEVKASLFTKDGRTIAHQFQILKHSVRRYLNVRLTPLKNLTVCEIPWEQRNQPGQYLFRTSAVYLNHSPSTVPAYVIKVNGTTIYVSPEFTNKTRILQDFADYNPQFPPALVLCNQSNKTVIVYNIQPEGYCALFNKTIIDYEGKFQPKEYSAIFQGILSGNTLLEGTYEIQAIKKQ